VNATGGAATGAAEAAGAAGAAAVAGAASAGVTGAGAGWAGAAAGASAGVAACPNATDELKPIATVNTKASKLRISFSLFAITQAIEADDDQACNRVWPVFAEV
jgi:hypothetical protein